LVALNSLPQGDKIEAFKTSDTSDTLNAAKSKAYSLFAQSLQLRTQLLPSSSPPLKRKFDEISVTDLANTAKTLNQEYQPWRDETLTKWSDKVKAASGLPINKKFKALNQSITHQLAENLADKPRLLDRTRTKRATFTVLGQPTALLDDKTPTSDPHIFDDLDFYHPLLEELVARKALELPVETWNRQETKGKKQGKDTRGSKGRKLRYHEHEKIQNFMAPVAAGTWHEEQIEYVFRG
jgi:protein AATF/BFR2